MDKGRVEFFSDGVIAVIITILVLELRAPHGAEWSAIAPLIPAFISYVLSFIYLGIYWSNHHHLLQAATQVNGVVLWANLHILFWLSLIPFVTGWMGENEFATLPVAVYGFNLLMAALAYYVLERTLIAAQGNESPTEDGRWRRDQGLDFSRAVCCGHRGRALLNSLGVSWSLRVCRPHGWCPTGASSAY